MKFSRAKEAWQAGPKIGKKEMEMGGWVHPGFEPGTSRSIAQDVP